MKELKLCVNHPQEPNHSHYSSDNCDYCKQIKQATLMQQTFITKNNIIYAQDKALTKASKEIETLTHDLEEANERIAKQMQNMGRRSNCPCDDWESAGTDPNTWEKLKSCNICGQISVR